MDKLSPSIKPISNTKELGQCFNVFKELRPHLKDQQEFIHQVLCQQKQGYKIVVYLENKEVVAGMGYRILDTLAWERIIYIDDLVTGNVYRGRGYGKALLNYAVNQAKQLNCKQIHLDTGYQRYDAHRLYLRFGFQLNSHHMALNLKYELKTDKT